MKITAFILLLFLSLMIATESKMSDGDKQGRKDKGNHGKDRNIGLGYDKDAESSAVADVDSPPASGQFISGTQEAVQSAGFGTGRWDKSSILMAEVICQGDAATISGCSWQLQLDCTEQEAAGVRCVENSVETVNVRLTGGRTKYEGNVVVTKDGRPGYICDDEWDYRDASVICRMLGFQGGKAYSGSHFTVMGTVSGIILDNVQCTGSELSLSQCLHEPWGQHDCTNSEYAGVACLNPDEEQGFVECGKRPLMERLHSQRNEYEVKQIVPSPAFKRIIRGMNAKRGANPWQAGVRLVYLFYPKFSKHHCGGTILSEYWILSAAHCFINYRQDHIVVRTGDHNNKVYDDHEQEFKIDVLITHERYGVAKAYDYDIALIKIRPQDGRGIVFNDYVQPACLPVSNTEYKAGMKCHISGWGETSYGDPNILQTAVVPIISESVCNLSYIGMVTPRMFCAGYLSGGVDTCYGDSGGPLVCNIQGKYTVMGITSWGDGCAKPNAPGVYAKVKEFLPWIKQKMQLY